MSSPRAVPSSRVAYFHRQNDALGVIPCHTVLFRRRSDALGATSTPWSPESPPELSKASRSSQTVHFHYQKHCPWPWEPVHARAHPESRQGSKTNHFHYQNIALGASPYPSSPRSPPRPPNYSFSSPKRCPGSHFQPEGAQEPTRASKLSF